MTAAVDLRAALERLAELAPHLRWRLAGRATRSPPSELACAHAGRRPRRAGGRGRRVGGRAGQRRPAGAGLAVVAGVRLPGGGHGARLLAAVGASPPTAGPRRWRSGSPAAARRRSVVAPDVAARHSPSDRTLDGVRRPAVRRTPRPRRCVADRPPPARPRAPVGQRRRRLRVGGGLGARRPSDRPGAPGSTTSWPPPRTAWPRSARGPTPPTARPASRRPTPPDPAPEAAPTYRRTTCCLWWKTSVAAGALCADCSLTRSPHETTPA